MCALMCSPYGELEEGGGGGGGSINQFSHSDISIEANTGARTDFFFLVSFYYT